MPKGKARSSKESKNKVAEVLAGIAAAHGTGSAMLMGKVTVENWQVISSGSLTFDKVTGVGGFPRARISELHGVEGGGKTTIALQTVASCHRLSGTAGYVDVEHALDLPYAKTLGVDLNKFVLSQPNSAEEALDIAERLVKSGVFDVIVVDSVAALVPQAELEGEMGDSHMGLQARLMGQAMRKMKHLVRKANCALIFINQIRTKMANASYGSTETTPGGRALPFAASLRVDIRRIASIKENEKVIGSRVKIKTLKNRGAAPYQEGECDLIFGRGIDRAREILDLGEEYKFIQKKGGSHSMHLDNEIPENIGKSRAEAAKFITENPELAERLASAIMSMALPKKKE